MPWTRYSAAELEALSPNAETAEADNLSFRTILGMGISPFYGDEVGSFLLGVLEDIYADLDDLVGKINDDDPTRLRDGVSRVQRRARMALALIPRLEAAEEAAESEVPHG